MKKSKNGITIISVVIMIVLIAIIAGVTITQGRNNFRGCKFTNFKYKYAFSTSKSKNNSRKTYI